MDTKNRSLAWHVRARFHLELSQGTKKRPGFVRAVVLGLIFVLGVLPVPNAPAAGSMQSTAAAAPIQSRPVEQLLNADGTLNLNTGWSGALDPHGWQGTLDAERGPLLERVTRSPAKPAANIWMPLGTGVNDTVASIAISGSDVYVGGNFTSAGWVENTSHIAKWDGRAWSSLGTGVDGSVWTLAASGSNVYVGGPFTSAGGVANTNHIARWDGSAWSAMGTGVDGTVWTLAASGGDVYVGGEFTSAGGVANTNHIAKWDGNAWSALGTETDDTVSAIATAGSNVYVGGYFSSAGGVANTYGVAKWDGSKWSAMGAGMDSPVYAIAVGGSDVYVGGCFDKAGGVPANNIAKWDGSAWSALGTGADHCVLTIAVGGTDVYMGGWFVGAGGVPANYIAKWDGSAWSALGTGTDNHVLAIAVSGSGEYVGGTFTSAGGLAASYIVRYGPVSSNADLGSLELSSGALAPVFTPTTTMYTANVAYAVTSVTVTPTASDGYATITVNGTPVPSGSASEAIALQVGANTITTVVTAQDGTTTKTYTVTVTRAATADLSNLVLSSGTLTPPFASGTTTYAATVATCATGITVTPTAQEASSAITVNGTPVVSGHASEPIALSYGSNTITIVVSAQDSAMTKTYSVTVTRAAWMPCTPAGGTWVSVTSPVTDPIWGLYSVAMASSSDGWAVGSKGSAPNGVSYGPLILHWDGSAWSQAAFPGVNGAYALNSVAMVSADEGWAVGGWGSHYIGGNTAGTGSTSGVILRWDGTAWSTWSGSRPAHLFALDILSGADIWAVGEYYSQATYNGGSAFTHWDGQTWHETINTSHLYGLNSVSMVSANDGWAVGNYDIMHWNGTAWSLVSTHPLSQALYAVAMVSANDGWSVGAGGTILHWDGSRWSQVNSPTSNMLISVAMVTSSDGWAVGDNGTILHWDGNVWSQVSSAITQQRLRSVTMISANEGWAGGRGGVILYYTNSANVFLPLVVR